MLPPGLYQMILEEEKTEDVGADLLPGQYLVRLRRRVGGRNLNAMVVGFQYLADTHRFLAELKQRLEAFALTLHPDRTRITTSDGSLLRTAGPEVRANLKPLPFSGSSTSSGGPGKAGG